jgi:hypothetical protein
MRVILLVIAVLLFLLASLLAGGVITASGDFWQAPTLGWLGLAFGFGSFLSPS